VRVCYLIQNHREPRQLLRLVRTLKRQSPEAVVLVCHDTTGCAVDPAELTALPAVHFLAVPGPIERGRLSLLEPYFRGVERLRALGVDYDWLVYLSAQDYPTQPLARSEAFLAAADVDGFLRFWPALAADTPWGRPKQGDRRYLYRYSDPPRWAVPLVRLLKQANGLQPWVHAHLTYGPRLGVRRSWTPFGDRWTLYGGSQWTTLRRACAEFVLESLEREPGLIDYYRHTVCPDESLVQTLLVNAGRFRLCDDNLRYVDSKGCRYGRPRLLGVADLPQLTAGGVHFARKFDLAHDARVLDLLDEHLG
jgi:Core-2/I-Branching enzyme